MVTDFQAPGYEPPPNYQEAPLWMIYGIKLCGCYKIWLVVGRHKVDSSHLDEWAPVKDMSFWLLDVIPHHFSPKQLIRDIDNVFINAKTKAKVWVQCGSEFGWYKGVILIIHKALYDLAMST